MQQAFKALQEMNGCEGMQTRKSTVAIETKQI